jgi:hypothetical protein
MESCRSQIFLRKSHGRRGKGGALIPLMIRRPEKEKEKPQRHMMKKEAEAGGKNIPMGHMLLLRGRIQLPACQGATMTEEAETPRKNLGDHLHLTILKRKGTKIWTNQRRKPA